MIKTVSSLEGQFLIAMPGMGDVRFEKSLIYICAHSSDGAMGFIVNRLVETPGIHNFFTQLNIVNEEEAQELAPLIGDIKLHNGGPVEPGRGFVLHSSDYQTDTTLNIEDDISLTATLEILRAIATGKGPEKILLALGYAGWASGQLEEEIASNGWLTADANADIIFDANLEDRYNAAIGMLGIDPSLLSMQSGHA